MAARARLSPAAPPAAGSDNGSPGLSDALLVSVVLSSTGGRLTGGRALIWDGTSARRGPTEAFCTVGADALLAAMGTAGAGAASVFAATAFVSGRVVSVAGCACGHGEATP